MTGTTQLTYGGVFLAVLAEQLCLPVPATLALIMAGALAAEGKMHLSLIVLVGVLGCLCGDGVWFLLGRRWGRQITRLLCRFSHDQSQCAENARNKFANLGMPLLTAAKFLPGLNGIMPPLAGAEGTSALSFIGFDGLGALLWTALYTALGYLFAHELSYLLQLVRHFGVSLAVLIGFTIISYAGWRAFLLVRMIRLLRLRRMSPAMLHRKLHSNAKLLLLDLRQFEWGVHHTAGEIIPGAIRVDPNHLRAAPSVVIPNSVDTVLYCSARRDALSASVALTLKRRGVERLWVLEGGVQAWKEAGLPLIRETELPETVLARLGIQLPEELLVHNRSNHVQTSFPS